MVTAYDYKRDKEIKKLLISDSKIAQMAPNVTADDNKNVVVGATEYMEYNVKERTSGILIIQETTQI